MKRAFKITLIILSFIPLYFAARGIIGGASLANDGMPVTNGLDNQLRYQSAYYLSLAFLIWWVIQDIHTRGTVMRLLVLAIFLGGLARLYSYVTVGTPPPHAVAGMFLELGAPILIFWHNYIVRNIP
jgi:hypothetical protein